jgi:ferredoxin--NADP+ reductase
MTYLSELDTSKSVTAKVIQSERITPDNAAEVRHIRLRVEQPGFTYHEGQHVGVAVPGPHAFGHAHHFRLYTIANCNDNQAQPEIDLYVRRCSYIDEFSGEEEPGIASNYLCNLKTGDGLTLTGPYGEAFSLPEDPDANLLMIGSGTGIAPFRAFVQHIYQKPEAWRGKVMLFYGARSGAENLYRNDYRQDFDNYYLQETFQAFEGLSKRPWMNREDEGLDNVLSEHAGQIWTMMQEPNTHVYLAGLEATRDRFEAIMQETAGSKSRWYWTREEMIEQDRWSELIYG